jgi:dihydrofolate reductase
MSAPGLTQYFTATTLDGFIADADNSLAWLFTRKREEDGFLDYDEFIAGVGAMAMGSTTYQWIVDHDLAGKDPSEWRWPYDLPCWVFTHRRLPVVPDAPVTFTSADIATVHEEMVQAAAGRNIWIVGGGDLAGQFAEAGRLDEVVVMIAPVTLGSGAPLLPRRVELRLDELGRNGDFACARYSVVHPPHDEVVTARVAERSPEGGCRRVPRPTHGGRSSLRTRSEGATWRWGRPHGCTSRPGTGCRRSPRGAVR